MRTLFLWVYLVIVGGFALAFYLMEYLGGDLYDNDFAKGYRDYVAKVAPLIAKDLQGSDLQNMSAQNSILAHWQVIIGEELQSLTLVPIPEQIDFSDGIVIVTQLDTTEMTDEIELLAKLPDKKQAHLALQFYFVDTVSEAYGAWYIKGIVAVYLFMALIVGVLVLFLSGYLQQIKSLTQSVIAGDLAARIKANPIPVFRTLSDNLNQMVQDLENKHQETDIFLGAIHHELRSPITKLRLALDMALNCKDETLLQELLQDMDVDLEELSTLMEDILMLSRLRLQEQTPELARLDISEFLSSIVDDLNNPKISLSSNKQVVVESNRLMLERAMVNIISNALKFAEQTVFIEIQKGENSIEISVSDDGPGLPKEARRIVFQPFYRIDKGRARSSGGVGLGLAIARLVMIKMSGDIHIEDSAMGGAKFVLELPLIETEIDETDLSKT